MIPQRVWIIVSIYCLLSLASAISKAALLWATLENFNLRPERRNLSEHQRASSKLWHLASESLGAVIAILFLVMVFSLLPAPVSTFQEVPMPWKLVAGLLGIIYLFTLPIELALWKFWLQFLPTWRNIDWTQRSMQQYMRQWLLSESLKRLSWVAVLFAWLLFLPPSLAVSVELPSWIWVAALVACVPALVGSIIKIVFARFSPEI